MDLPFGQRETEKTKQNQCFIEMLQVLSEEDKKCHDLHALGTVLDHHTPSPSPLVAVAVAKKILHSGRSRGAGAPPPILDRLSHFFKI